jgi:hypothetical protein
MDLLHKLLALKPWLKDRGLEYRDWCGQIVWGRRDHNGDIIPNEGMVWIGPIGTPVTDDSWQEFIFDPADSDVVEKLQAMAWLESTAAAAKE